MLQPDVPARVAALIRTLENHYFREVHAMLTRLIDFLKGNGITAVLTGLNHEDEASESAAVGISSLIDTWIELKGLEFGAERNRDSVVRLS